jgi:UDP-2,4-diacetamido-2,4,6-trideoxy-beta-L-altropyranose hydrolase
MQVFFRVDASRTAGHGHVMRCLSLAQELREHGARVSFVSREHPGNLCGLIEERGFAVSRLPEPAPDMVFEDAPVHAAWLGASWQEDARQTMAVLDGTTEKPDWLVVDHYALDVRWESALSRVVGKILVIDDLADRRHEAQVLLDQNLYPDMAQRYVGLLSSGCRALLGPSFALLRREFVEARAATSPRNAGVQKIFVFFGGSDLTNETEKALASIAALGKHDVSVDVVVGAGNSRYEAIKDICTSMRGMRLHCQIDNMAQLMSEADLSLGAGGSTTWERCALGLPALVISVADNQIAIADGVDKAGAHRHLGLSKNVSVTQLTAAIEAIASGPEFLEKMSRSASALVDAKGCERVIKTMEEFA